MDEKYSIVQIENPEESSWGIIGKGVGTYNRQQAGDNRFQRICYVLHNDDQKIAGGVIAEAYWEWLYIDLLWVEEQLRRQGFGHLLLIAAEQEAMRLGAKHAYLDTFSFQAPEFYKRHGYEVFGELQDFPIGHTRYFFMKELK
jgi:GNAT superfamily N-acetyltransferase